MGVKFTKKEVELKLKKKNLRLIDKTYKGLNSVHTIKCLKCRYKRSVKLSGVLSMDSKCPKCINKMPWTIERLQKLAKLKGLIFIKSKKYENRKSVLKWKCIKCRKYLNKTKDSIEAYKGKYCTECKGTNSYGNIVTKEDVKKLVKKKKGKLKKSFIYENNKSKFEVKCEEGHTFDTTWSHIDSGHWCPKCAAKRIGKALRHTLVWLRKLAKDNDFKLLDKTYKGVDKYHNFKCSNNHIFKTKPNSIQQGYGCKECSRYKQERRLAFVLNEMFSTVFYKTKPKWLNGLELDGYNKKLKVAFEYQGEQHFFKTYHNNHSKVLLNKIKKYDKIKVQKCYNRNIKLIKIKYDMPLETWQNYIIDRCKGFKVKKLSKKVFNNIIRKADRNVRSIYTDIPLDTISAMRKDYISGVTDEKVSKKYNIPLYISIKIRKNLIYIDDSYDKIYIVKSWNKLSLETKSKAVKLLKANKPLTYISKKCSIAMSSVYKIQKECNVFRKDFLNIIKNDFSKGLTVKDALIKYNKSYTTLCRLRKAA